MPAQPTETGTTALTEQKDTKTPGSLKRLKSVVLRRWCRDELYARPGAICFPFTRRSQFILFSFIILMRRDQPGTFGNLRRVNQNFAYFLS
jgi:hypothetical protein